VRGHCRSPGASVAMVSNRNDWRYTGDKSLLDSLLADDGIRARLESSASLRERDPARLRLLGGAVMVDSSLLPQLDAAVRRLDQHFPEVGAIECFVYNAPDVNAFVTTGRTRTLVALSSGAVNHLNGSELAFVLGHELGHATFGHLAVAASRLVEDPDLLPAATMRVRAWQRASEISADRAGLVVCGSVDAAARALFKAASGITAEGLVTSPQRFAAQWQRLVDEVVAEGQRDFWQISHPFPPLRIRAMLLFWEASQSSAPEAISDADTAIARMLAMMDPGAGDDTLRDPLLEAFFFWGGLHIALSDGAIAAGELGRLRSVLPPGVDLDDAIRDARSRPTLCLERFREHHKSRRRKLTAIELHRIVYGLIDVASADGHVSADERTRLVELGAALGLPPSACEVIVSQHNQEVLRAD
jgi:tellurite resistance protein